MASRQADFASLAPEEKQENEKWAQEMIARMKGCPDDFKFIRKSNPPGYQCERGGHIVTDELLAEGLGGLYVHCERDNNKPRPYAEKYFLGPYYPNPNEKGKFLKMPRTIIGASKSLASVREK